MHQAEDHAIGFGAGESKAAIAVFDTLKWRLKREGFEWADQKIVTTTGAPYLSDIKKAVATFDLKHLGDQVRRMEASVETDPP